MYVDDAQILGVQMLIEHIASVFSVPLYFAELRLDVLLNEPINKDFPQLERTLLTV